MTKKKLLIYFICVIFPFVVHVNAQDKPVPVKISEYDDERESIEVFNKRIDIFLRRLSKEPVTTFGFIAVSGKDYATFKTLRSHAKLALANNKDLKKRVDISEQGIHYNTRFEKTEFWFIPANSDPPYVALTADCDCPEVRVEGKPEPKKANRTSFVANVSGGYFQNPVTYRWRVTGGTIVKGQGTPTIQVKINSSRKAVTAEVEIGGVEESCFCALKSSFTTKIRLAS